MKIINGNFQLARELFRMAFRFHSFSFQWNFSIKHFLYWLWASIPSSRLFFFVDIFFSIWNKKNVRFPFTMYLSSFIQICHICFLSLNFSFCRLLFRSDSWTEIVPLHLITFDWFVVYTICDRRNEWFLNSSMCICQAALDLSFNNNCFSQESIGENG